MSSKIDEITNRLNYLKETKTLLKETILANGGIVADDEFRGYVGSINDLLDDAGDWVAFIEQKSGLIDSLPESITSIGAGVFSGKRNLVISEIPKNVVSIESGAFADCTSLTEITFKGTPDSIAADAFSGCTNLATINVPWSQGKIINAPWGANNAIINYDQISLSEEASKAWADVFKSIEAGTYATDYSLGYYIPLDLGSEGVMNMQIIAFDTDELADGSGKAPITWASLYALNTGHQMNPQDSNGIEGTGGNGGWEKSDMRVYLKNTIKPRIPSEIRTKIREVIKIQSNYPIATQTTIDDVWIPSAREVFGTITTVTNGSISGIDEINASEVNGVVYSNFFIDNNNRRKANLDKTKTWWYLRTAASSTEFSRVEDNGTCGTAVSTAKNGVVLCFCT